MPTLTMPEKEPPTKKKIKVGRQPPYHVILHNDDSHSYDYVIHMLGVLFGKKQEECFKLAKEVDEHGIAIVDTTTLERAELKRDQIHAFGPDKAMKNSKGSMSATLEAAE